MFDYTRAMENLIAHIVETSPEFEHVNLDHMLVSYIQTRSPGAHGIFASLQPLKGEAGSETITRRGRKYKMPEIEHKGRKILYIVYFALPRFANLSFEEKLTTVFHELYHISPEFNGDIRRFPGRNYAHGHSKKRFHERVRVIAERYLERNPDSQLLDFLRMDFEELRGNCGGVTGQRVRPPKLRLVK